MPGIISAVIRRALTIVVAMTVLAAAPAAASSDPVGWPLGEGAEPGLSPGMEWVRTNPMLITALIPSMLVEITTTNIAAKNRFKDFYETEEA